jgi:hypothetical protein
LSDLSDRWPPQLREPIRLVAERPITRGEARINRESDGTQSFSLHGPQNAFLRFEFPKSGKDDALMFAYHFEGLGPEDEFALWVDDTRLVSLSSLAKEDRGTAAVGIDDFDDGPHLLTLALYSQRGNKQVQIRGLVKLVKT